MSLVSAALVPHNPLLIPNIGKANRNLFSATLKACEEVAETIKNTSPDIIVILSNYGPKLSSALAINVAPTYTSDFSLFGDLVTRLPYTGTVLLPARLREQLTNKLSLRLVTNRELDYASSTALFLSGVTETTPILPLTTTGYDLKTHFNNGKILQAQLLTEDYRIAIIGAVDLSHRLTKNSPAGYSPKAKKLDQKIISALGNSKSREIINLSEESLTEAGIEDAKVMALFFGLLDGFETNPRVLSYESPFGTGHAVTLFTL